MEEAIAPEPSYLCSEPDCLVSGPANEMFNLPCSPYRVSLADLRKLILCESHATHPRTRKSGRRMGERVFPLRITLEMMTRRVNERQEKGSYLAWYLNGAAKEPQQSRGEFERQYLNWYYDRNPKKWFYPLPNREP